MGVVLGIRKVWFCGVMYRAAKQWRWVSIPPRSCFLGSVRWKDRRATWFEKWVGRKTLLERLGREGSLPEIWNNESKREIEIYLSQNYVFFGHFWPLCWTTRDATIATSWRWEKPNNFLHVSAHVNPCSLNCAEHARRTPGSHELSWQCTVQKMSLTW